MLYRMHKGGFSESLATTIEVNSLQEVLDHENKINAGFSDKFHIDDFKFNLKDISCKFYCNDNRMPEWKKTYIIEVIGSGVLGFSNGELK